MKRIYKNLISTTTLMLALGLSLTSYSQYCTPTYSTGCGSNDNIGSFVLEGNGITISNTNSGCSPNGYGDYTSLAAADVSPGLEYTGQISTDYSSPSFETARIWIDWDDSGTFDSNEIIETFDELVTGMNSFTFTVPVNAIAGIKRLRVVLNYSTVPADPCGSFTWGETEDYNINVIALEDCEGQPDAGEITNGSFEICANIPFTLNASGFSLGSGLIRQWQKRENNGAWEDIAGANGGSLNFTNGISQETDFRFYIECENNELSDVTDFITVSITPPGQCYCTPTYTYGCTSGDRIAGFGLTGDNGTEIDNQNSGCSANAYGDYTLSFDPVDLTPGLTYSGMVATDYSSPSSEYVRIWIDWNDDGSFDNEDEIVAIDGLTAGGSNFSFSVPPTAPPGIHKMRVRLVYNPGSASSIDPCTSYSYGETEDYLVNVIALDACTGTPDAGEIDADENFGVCEGVAFNLSVIGATQAGNMTYQWQMREPNGDNTWNDIPGANSFTLNVPNGITEITEYRFYVKCNNGDEDDYSNVITTFFKPTNECYCIPVGTNSSYAINDFSTTEGTDNITNTGSVFSQGGYGDFTTMKVSKVQGGQINFSVTHSSTSVGFRIWVDWNQDGTFDASEVAYQSSSYAGNHSGTISVPLNALPGNTRMRIVNHWLSNSGDVDPCSTAHTYGEFEDYTFEVIELDECSGTPDAGTVTDREVCGGVAFTLSSSGVTADLSGINYQWQVSTDQINWADIPGATTAQYTVTNGVNETTYYRLIVECENDNNAVDTSDVMTVTIKDPAECFCIPVGTNSSYFINDFNTTNGIQNISNNGTGFSTGGYGDFTDMSVEQLIGESINFTTNIAGGTAGFRVWIDWNQNGTFEPTEVAYQSSGYNSSHSGTIAIPMNAMPGATTMRIASHWLSSVGDVDPCATNHTYGEFEDYTFVVITIPEPTITQASGTPDCENGTELTLTGDLEGNQAWYWQESEDGTSMDNNANPFTVYENGTYYARTYDPDSDIWSIAASITVTNVPTAPAPPTPVADENPACLPGTQITVDPATGGLIYYWQGTSNTSSSTSDNAEDPYEVTETGTYYVKAYDPNTNCWSEPEGIFVTVGTVIPIDPIADQLEYHYCEGITSAEIEITTSSNEIEVLDSPFSSGGNGCGGGVMFNVTNDNQNPISLTGFDILLYNSGSQSVNVYYKSGTYNGFQENSGAWTLLGNYTVNGSANTMVNFDINELEIQGGETMGIFINYYASYTNATAGSQHSDDNITLTIGDGLCDPFGGVNTGRAFNGSIHYTLALPNDVIWYDAATGGNVVGMDNPLETVGTIVMPIAEEGTYEFYAAYYMDGCESENRTLITVNIKLVNVDLVGTAVSCNNGSDGSFYVDNIECGETPFEFSVDGGDFGAIPNDLSIGEHTVIVKDADGNETGEITVIIENAPAPSDLVVNSYSNNSVTVSWTGNGSETEWNIEWGAVGFTPGTGNEIGSAVSNAETYTITGLNASTQYHIYVSANCGEGSTPGDWIGVAIRTTCNPMPALGYCEDFEVLEELNCWLVYDMNQDDEYWMIYLESGIDGGDAAGIYTLGSGGNMDDYIILPPLTLTGNEVLTYWHAAYSASYPNSYQVVLSTDGISFDNIEVVHQDTVYSTTFSQVTVDLSDYTGDVYLAFHVPPGSLGGYYLFIDDVCIDICNPVPGIDGSLDVCRDNETLDLNTVISSEYTHGDWVFPDNPGAVSGSNLDLTGLASGSYEVIYIVEAACSSDTTYATVNVYAPSSAGNGQTITVCKNQPIDLFAALSGNVDMGGTWYDYNLNQLSGSQPSAPNLPANYNYYYVVSNGVCDADTATVEVIVDGGCDWLSVQEELFTTISVYPNPTSDYINIVNSSNISELKAELQDVNGRIVLTEDNLMKNSSEATISLDKLAKGVYTLRVFNEDGQKIFKIIKQ